MKTTATRRPPPDHLLDDPPPNGGADAVIAEFDEKQTSRFVEMIEQIREELGEEEGRIVLTRKRGSDTAWKHVGELPLEPIDVEAVKRLYGGGRYLAKARGKGGHFRANFNFAIDEVFLGEYDRARSGGGAAPAAPAQPDLASIVTAMAPFVKNSGGDQTGVLVAMINAQAQTQVAMFQALAGMNRGAPGGGLDTTAILLKMLDRTPASATDDAVKTLAQMRDLFGAEKEKEEGGIMSLLTQLAPSLLPLLLGRGTPPLTLPQAGAPNLLPLPAPNLPPLPAPAPQAQPLAGDSQPDWSDWPAGLRELALAKADPALAADVLAALWQAREDKLAALLEGRLRAPEEHKSWLDAVRVEVAKMLAEPPSQQGEPEKE